MKNEWIEQSEFPFDSTIKRMAVIFQHQREGNWVFIKGAVESVMEVCTKVNAGKDTMLLDDHVKDQVLNQMHLFASQGLVRSLMASSDSSAC
jgi:magnesium-transporting ATPase (P-type)